MYSYIMRRLAFGAVTIVGVSILVFVVLRILPGDPLVAIFGADGFTKLSEAERANYMAALGLSDPLWIQYFNWIKDIARGDMGRSFFRSESVAEMILRRGPLTAEIALISVFLGNEPVDHEPLRFLEPMVAGCWLLAAITAVGLVIGVSGRGLRKAGPLP